MNKNFIIGLLILVLTFTITAAVSAEELYNFELKDGASIIEESDYWYLKLITPQISGMSDEEQQQKLNEYFESFIDYVSSEYKEDKEYFEENYEGEDSPLFGYEYFYDKVCESNDYFVFRTTLFYAAGSSMAVNEYWTLNKHTGKLTELSDIADRERLTEIRGMIFDAMKQENETGGSFWLDEENFDIAFSYIEEYHHWYVNENGNLVITFDKYEIAPGASGESRFEIAENKAVLVKEQKYSFDLYAGDTVEINESN